MLGFKSPIDLLIAEELKLEVSGEPKGASSATMMNAQCASRSAHLFCFSIGNASVSICQVMAFLKPSARPSPRRSPRLWKIRHLPLRSLSLSLSLSCHQHHHYQCTSFDGDGRAATRPSTSSDAATRTTTSTTASLSLSCLLSVPSSTRFDDASPGPRLTQRALACGSLSHRLNRGERRPTKTPNGELCWIYIRRLFEVVYSLQREKMPLGLILGLGRAFRRKRTSSLDILSSKRAPRNYYKGKNCIPTGFHTRKGGYVVMQEKLPNYVVPDLADFKLKPYVSQCPREVKTTEATDAAK